jgi:hypothetical protein
MDSVYAEILQELDEGNIAEDIAELTENIRNIEPVNDAPQPRYCRPRIKRNVNFVEINTFNDYKKNTVTDTVVDTPQDNSKDIEQTPSSNSSSNSSNSYVIPTYNLISEEYIDLFSKGLQIPENKYLSVPQSTTITLNGQLSNVRFTEEDLIKKVYVNEHIVVAKCNFGSIVHESFKEPLKPRYASRGKKREEKRKLKYKNIKPRKIQGDGTCFNSQITFYSRHIIQTDDQNFEYIFKFKTFRTGKLQLPGAKPELIRPILNSAGHIINMLNDVLHQDETDPDKLTSLVGITPVMKNYKFRILMPPEHFVDLFMLKSHVIHAKNNWDVNSKCPKIFDVKYTGEETKLYIKFRAPTVKKPKKLIRLNIFTSGKIDLLGAAEDAITIEIYNFMLFIIQTYQDKIIVSNSSNNDSDDEYELIES